MTLPNYATLVLNADFKPLSYFPLSIWSWQDTMRAVFLNRVIILSEYDVIIHSPGRGIPLPSVVALRDYIPPQRRAAFTRLNVFLRDRFTCQYCGQYLPPTQLTFDHVTPRARGGRTHWHNIVTACGPCNRRKGSRLLKEAKMTLLHAPYEPKPTQLQENGRLFPPHSLHESWQDYLNWNCDLEE